MGNYGEIKVSLNEKEIENTIKKLVEEKLQELALPKVLSIDIKDVKRITGINSDVTLQKILSDPRILQHQFRLGEGGPRHWDAKGFEEAYQQVMNDFKRMF